MPLRILPDLLEPGLPGGRLLVPDTAVGTVREWPTAEIRLRSHRLAAALESYGLTPGTPGAVVAAPGAQGLVATFALLSAGASVLPLDPTYSDSSLVEAMGRGAVRFVFVENPGVLDRVVRMRPDLDSLEMVILMEPPEGDRPSPALLASAAEAVGAEILAEDPERVDRILRRVEADENATTGASAGSHRDALRQAETLRARAGIEPGDIVLAGFPFGHPDYVSTVAACLAAGAVPALGRSGSFPDILAAELALVRPSLVLARTEAIDSLCRRYGTETASRGILSKRLHAWALDRGLAPHRGWTYRLADRLVLRKARGWFGGRLRRVAVTGGEPGVESRNLHAALGIDLVGP